MVEFAVDFQSFIRSSNISVCKELAIIQVIDENIEPLMYLFKAPCKWRKLLDQEKKTNRYLENHFHKISWNSGTIPSSDFIQIIQSNLKNAQKIYVKGLVKQKIIEEILPDK